METVIREINFMLVTLRENETVALSRDTLTRWRKELEKAQTQLKTMAEHL